MGTKSEYHWMYQTKAWQDRRTWQLRHEPLCARCRDMGVLVGATVVHHAVPHKGVWAAFMGSSLTSLCKPCHDGPTQSEERAGYSQQIGDDGWPVDARHPINAT